MTDNHVTSKTPTSVLHQWKSYENVSCIKWYFLFIETGGLKSTLKLDIRRRLQQISLHLLPCDVKCFDCKRWESQNVYFKSCQLMFRGLIVLAGVARGISHCARRLLELSEVEKCYSHSLQWCLLVKYPRMWRKNLKNQPQTNLQTKHM